MKKIAMLVNLERQKRIFNEKYFDQLQNLGDLKRYDQKDFSNKEYYIRFVEGAEIIITSWESPVIDQDILNVCPNLKAVIHAAGSVKPIVSDELINKKIPVSSSSIALGEGVAETALGFAISACKGFYQLSRDTKNLLWNENVKETVKDFYDITVGVISGGFAGRHFVKLLKNFHVDILLYDPTLSSEEIEKIGAKKTELEELLKASDVISIHAPSIPATNHMLNKDNLPLIQDGAILINTARGSIINETDLIEELKKNRFFACIDVTKPEPPTAENELRQLHNVVLTPHIAGTVTNGLKRIARHVCMEVEAVLKGENLRAQVDLSQLSKLA